MSSGYVVDTSVVVRWFLDQIGHQHARRVLHEFLIDRLELETIDFARIELTEVLRRRGLQQGRLGREEFLAGSRIIDDLGVVVAWMPAFADCLRSDGELILALEKSPEIS